MMRDPLRVWRTSAALHRWLRRTALTAIPIAGLCHCGDSCPTTLRTSDLPGSGTPGWAIASQHSADECRPYCADTSGHFPCEDREFVGCMVIAADAGTMLQCQTRVARCPNCGRLPAGVKWATLAAQPSAVAAHLAAAAHLEGAAVFAFDALERELVAHRAPAELISRARSAQRDEKRHHSAMSRLAIRFGASVPAVEVDSTGIRTLVEIAIENAVEGCVRETYGAAVAALQGESAGNLSIRRAMRAIAIDEAEHASLAWHVDAWARPRLTQAQRAKADEARAHARERLAAEVRESAPAELSTVLGLPTPAAAEHLIGRLSALWG